MNQSNAATLSTAASTEGPRPNRMAMTSTPTRYTMTRFTGEKNSRIITATTVSTATMTATRA